MANLRFLLGFIPKTSVVEEKENALIKEYAEFQAYEASGEPAHFQELQKECTSAAFKESVARIRGQKFSQTEEFKKQQEYAQIKKSAPCKTYFKVKDSQTLADLKAMESSAELKQYEELQQFIASPAFLEKKNAANPKEFRNSEEGRKEQQFLSLQKSSRFKNYFKFRNSEKFKTYTAFASSKDLERYNELEAFLASEEFRKVKEYMALTGKQKYEQSEEFKKEQEYFTLLKSDKRKWYEKCLKTDKFRELKAWNKTFEDDFTTDKLDRSKWITRYYWGNELLNDAYSLAGDLHFLTDGNNLEIKNSVLSIKTRQENVSGKAWDPAFGFIPKNFNYTSGLISTGKSFRQKYGRFQAKIRLNHPGKVTHAFWMLAEKIMPQVDVLKSNSGKIFMSNIWGNITASDGVHKHTSKVSAGKVSQDFYIYTLEWTAEKLVWKINDLVVATITESVPQDPMYLLFSSAILAENPEVPASFDIDWVRAYEKVN